MKTLQNAITIGIIAITLFSCYSDEESVTPTPEPQLLEEYYFKGTLDGEPLNIERKIYNVSDYNPGNSYSIDYGGSQTNDIEVIGEEGTGFCYGHYACGIGHYDWQPNYDQFDTAKMYFTRIPVGDCSLENELTTMRDFLELPNYEYQNFYAGQSLITNSVALDFFPAGSANLSTYYSSRFGDNTDATYSITSVEEVETGKFIVKGSFSCKLYKFNDDTDFKTLENGQFNITVSSNLTE